MTLYYCTVFKLNWFIKDFSRAAGVQISYPSICFLSKCPIKAKTRSCLLLTLAVCSFSCDDAPWPWTSHLSVVRFSAVASVWRASRWRSWWEARGRTECRVSSPARPPRPCSPPSWSALWAALTENTQKTHKKHTENTQKTHRKHTDTVMLSCQTLKNVTIDIFHQILTTK